MPLEKGVLKYCFHYSGQKSTFVIHLLLIPLVVSSRVLVSPCPQAPGLSRHLHAVTFNPVLASLQQFSSEVQSLDSVVTVPRTIFKNFRTKQPSAFIHPHRFFPVFPFSPPRMPVCVSNNAWEISATFQH